MAGLLRRVSLRQTVIAGSAVTCLISAGLIGSNVWGANPPAHPETAPMVRSAPPVDMYDGPRVVSVAFPTAVIASRAANPVVDPKSRVSPKGTLLWKVSTTGSNNLPVTARTAYHRAADALHRTDRSCHLPWTLLAGIGRVESDHGRYGKAELATDGTSRPAIIGPELNGNGGFAAIRDTDDGKYDKDTVWDRAVGPMQFLPRTWRALQADGNGDKKLDPNNIFDASRGTATYLCTGSSDLRSAGQLRAAIFSYNHSEYYVDLVLALERGYRTGDFSIPPPPMTTPPPAAKPKPAATRSPTKAPTKAPTQTLTSTSPSPDPDPTPTPPEEPPPALDLDTITGTLTACDTGFCLNESALDLGDRMAETAAADFDGDGAVATNQVEFTGLVGQPVTLQVKAGTWQVYTVNGKGYRNADGSFA